MASGPSFAPADAVPARGGDLLDVVAGLDRQINQLSALRALAEARKGRSAGQASPFRRTRKAGATPVNSECGISQAVVGGRICVCTAMAALISPAMPAAALV